MKKVVTIIAILSVAILSGCKAPKMAWVDVQDRFDAHRHEKVNDMFYMGSDKSDHYLFHAYLTTYIKRVYRVDQSELTITTRFPVTNDQDAWRKLDMPLRIDPSNVTITSEQSPAGDVLKAAPEE